MYGYNSFSNYCTVLVDFARLSVHKSINTVQYNRPVVSSTYIVYEFNLFSNYCTVLVDFARLSVYKSINTVQYNRPVVSSTYIV
jgi:hypothetical protein